MAGNPGAGSFVNSAVNPSLSQPWKAGVYDCYVKWSTVQPSTSRMVIIFMVFGRMPEWNKLTLADKAILF